MKRALLSLVLLVCTTTGAFAESCPGISRETTQRLFERVKQVAVGAGYHFEGMGTNKSELVVLWSLNGKECPSIRVAVGNCTSVVGLASLQLHVPQELPVQCPGLDAVVTELSSALASEHPVGIGLSLPASAFRVTIMIVALVLVLGLLIRRLLAPSGFTFGWGDAAWIALTMVAATPFFFNTPLAVTMELGVAWIVFAVLLFDRDLVSAESQAQKFSLFGLFGFSLLVHWWWSSGGPGDLHLNLSGIWSWSFGLELRWGPAPIALFRLLAMMFGGLRDTQIVWCNLVLSSLVPLLVYGIVVELGVSKPAALLAAVVTTAHPLLIAFSGVLERQPAYLFAAAGATLALIGFLKRGKPGRLVAFVLGTVLATTCRPEGVHVLALSGAIVLLVPAPRRVRATAALVLAVLVPLGFGYTRYVLGGEGQFHFLLGAGWKTVPGLTALGGQFPFAGTILLDGDFTPLAWIVVWVAGLALGLRRRAAWVALLSLVALDLAWRWSGLYRMFLAHERQVASARYESILLIPFAIAVALFIQAVLKTNKWVQALCGVAFLLGSAATFARPYTTLVQPFTVDYEYRFLKKYALALPPQARLYVLDSPISDIGFLDAHLVGQFVGSRVSFELWSERQCEDLPSDLSQTYLYIGSSCAALLDNDPGSPLPTPQYANWMRDCAAIRARVGGDAVEEIDVPAHKMAWHDFHDSTVHLAIYRLQDPSVCALGENLRVQRAQSREHPEGEPAGSP